MSPCVDVCVIICQFAVSIIIHVGFVCILVFSLSEQTLYLTSNACFILRHAEKL